METISLTRFVNLQSLVLCSLELASISAVCRIEMPKLTQLDLSNNKISSLSSLAKVSLPELTAIKLGRTVLFQI